MATDKIKLNFPFKAFVPILSEIPILYGGEDVNDQPIACCLRNITS
jgi:hypothetical protein